MLRPAQIELKWIDCTSRLLSASCLAPQVPTDVIIRFLPRALPQASANALGMASFSADYAAALIFYDRILALRTHRRLLPAMLGRVMAHEITHLVLPEEGHSHAGLMRAMWSTGDLDLTSNACPSLSARAVQLMRSEVLRRMGIAPGHLQGKTRAETGVPVVYLCEVPRFDRFASCPSLTVRVLKAKTAARN
jgi:hypothetical protein